MLFHPRAVPPSPLPPQPISVAAPGEAALPGAVSTPLPEVAAMPLVTTAPSPPRKRRSVLAGSDSRRAQPLLPALRAPTLLFPAPADRCCAVLAREPRRGQNPSVVAHVPVRARPRPPANPGTVVSAFLGPPSLTSPSSPAASRPISQAPCIVQQRWAPIVCTSLHAVPSHITMPSTSLPCSGYVPWPL